MSIWEGEINEPTARGSLTRLFGELWGVLMPYVHQLRQDAADPTAPPYEAMMEIRDCWFSKEAQATFDLRRSNLEARAAATVVPAALLLTDTRVADAAGRLDFGQAVPVPAAAPCAHGRPKPTVR